MLHSTFDTKAKPIHLKTPPTCICMCTSQFGYKLVWPTCIEWQALALSTLQGEELPVYRNPMFTVKDYNCHRLYMKHSFCYITVCVVVTQYMFWVGNNACVVNISYRNVKMMVFIAAVKTNTERAFTIF